MGEIRELKSTGVRRALRLRSERRILCVEPIQKGARFGRGWRDQRDLCRGREESDRGRIHHLEDIETESVQAGRSEKKPGDRDPPPAGTFPVKEQTPLRLSVARRAHGCGVVASATEVMPRSSAAFVTSITRS